MFLIWNSIRGGSIGIIAPGYISRMCVSLWPFADMELVATGYRGHQNSLVYFCPASPTQHVVFFQGDGQNLEANMTQEVELALWGDWCLENTCSLMQKKFPGSAIWVVRPSRMLRSLFSSFQHFVESSITGVPSYSSNHGAILHVRALIEDAVQQMNAGGVLKSSVADTVKLPVAIVGFSKGCVVLNQIVHELVNCYKDPSELATDSERSRDGEPSSQTGTTTPGSRDNQPKATPTEESTDTENKAHISKPLPLDAEELELLKQFVSRIKAFYWLDAGHSGTSGAWVTEDNALKALASLKIPVHVDVTPHQVRDADREWIGLEEAEFVAKLRQLGATFTEKLHFEDEGKSLERHFQVLKAFEV